MKSDYMTYYAVSARCLECGASTGYVEKGWWIFKKRFCMECGKRYVGTFRYDENVKWKTTHSAHNGWKIETPEKKKKKR